MTETHPIKAYRDRTGESLDDLAKRLGTSKATLSRIENGLQPVSLKMLPKVTQVTLIPKRELRPDLAELLTGDAA